MRLARHGVSQGLAGGTPLVGRQVSAIAPGDADLGLAIASLLIHWPRTPALDASNSRGSVS
jgi:hypothetical protein